MAKIKQKKYTKRINILKKKSKKSMRKKKNIKKKM